MIRLAQSFRTSPFRFSHPLGSLLCFADMQLLMSLQSITMVNLGILPVEIPPDKMLLTRLAPIRTDLCVCALVPVEMLLLVTDSGTKATLLLHGLDVSLGDKTGSDTMPARCQQMESTTAAKGSQQSSRRRRYWTRLSLPIISYAEIVSRSAADFRMVNYSAALAIHYRLTRGLTAGICGRSTVEPGN